MEPHQNFTGSYNKELLTVLQLFVSNFNKNDHTKVLNIVNRDYEFLKKGVVTE